MLIQTVFPSPFPAPLEICYISTFPNQQAIPLYNGSRLKANHLERRLIGTKKIDHSFFIRQYFNVYISSITPEAHTYWSQVDQIVNRTGSIFDTPPAPIRGNIVNVNDPDEEVLGFFEAARVDTSRFFVFKKDVPYFIESLCEYDWRKPRREYHKGCFDCLTFRNSTKVRPGYWGK